MRKKKKKLTRPPAPPPAPTPKKSKPPKKKKYPKMKRRTFEEMEQYLDYIGGPAGALALTGAAAASAYYLASRPTPRAPLVDLTDQSTVQPGPDMVRVSKFYKEAREGKFVSCLHADARTLYDTFRRGAKESNNGPCLGWRETPTKPWLHYNEALLRAKNLGSGLVTLGLAPGVKSFVGIYSVNCPEWVLTEQAVYTYSMVLVPLYDTLGPDATAFIIKEAEISVVVCEDDAKANLLLEKAPRCLKKIVAIKPVQTPTVAKAKARFVDIYSLEEVERMGAAKDHPEVPPSKDDLCTICYTSGTTGNPKGVMLTHENVVASMSAVMMQMGDQRPNSTDVLISYLPLAHMLERCCQNAMYSVGGAVGFFTGDMHRLTDDFKALRPTVMPAVPRVLNRIYDKVMAEAANSFVKRLTLSLALSAKESEIRRGILRNNSFWDVLVFRKVQDALGGRVRLMVVGSAPISGAVLSFIRCAAGCLVMEGYGQTECTAPITLTVQGDHVPEHVGPPVACCCVKLVDVPEMEYMAANGQGEVCVKGTNVFQGYFKNPEQTAEVKDSQGWHHTGDIGMWLPNGTLKIIDRKKHIFKLAQGEYIVPDKIEMVYARSQYVHQSCVVAVVVPDVDVIKCWATEHNIPGTLSVLCNNSQVKQLILEDMLAWGKEAGLKYYEQVKDIYLHPDPFSVQNHLLTPTLKSKRPQLKAYFKPQIEDMYVKLA
ncbi:LOW QUALITY PROTEIN: Long-chain-fatty-acid--CoA ligase 5 [Frankliniella fusca]|uniref:Long-chain-fatty-acid--CoA ligase n=1 Tax=Frankliniella fusca TaxID=407009 RepID=A0AAE1HHN2_9NEOP|nr:LOW QUALITY PROTEIN: Long-chain-fatty-acid--CoA ligase 5 [Frankliniella fusca]